jgi:hypothetical protein
VPIRGLFARVLAGVGLVCGGTLVIAGGVAMRGPGLVAVGLAGMLAACTGAGIARESPGRGRRSIAEVAVQAAAWTVGTLLLVAGIDAVAGGVFAALAVGAAAVGGAIVLGVRGRKVSGQRGPGAAAPHARPGNTVASFPPALDRSAADTGTSRADVPGAALLLPPVSALSTAALGREWLRTTAALTGRLEPAVRQSIVARREEALDELERRDPEGFARWLAAGPVPGSDPAGYVRGGPVADTDAA